MKPLKHQRKFAKGYDGPSLIVHEGGTGKTVCACLWLRDGRDADALVVCPKKVVRKWEAALSAWKTRATVVSKEQFKKLPLREWSAKVIDEADEFASPLFVAKQRSQLSSALYALTAKYPEMPTLLLTATPIRSTPWNLHTLMAFAGNYVEWKEWRSRYFEQRKMPFMKFPAWLPKAGWRHLMRPVLEREADIVLLRDCVGELPPVTEEKVAVPSPEYVRQPDDKPFFDEHRSEQASKAAHILEYGRRFRKVLVVAYYREQIAELEEALSRDKETFAIHGGVKDQEAVIAEATESDDCYFIVQASIGAGFDADTFSCIVFASMSYAVRDLVQLKFRVRRIHNLHPVLYAYLLGGRCDRAILRNVEMGKDFVPSEWEE